MKNSTSTVVKIATMAIAFFCLLPSSVFATNDPIPGVDIIVRKKPGGSAIKATTDMDGNFTFAKLEPGKYVLTVNASQNKAAINTTRSNIRRPSISTVAGVEVVTVPITLGADIPQSVEIEITKTGAKITGNVSRAGAPTASGTKSK